MSKRGDSVARHGEVARSRLVAPGVLAAVIGLWGLTLMLVPPAGNFPLNDDWIYAQAVKTWLETGTYQSHPFATANLVGQAAWGKLFASCFGFSFVALRWSSLVLWLLAAWAVSLSALHLRARPFMAAMAGGLVIANPLAMNLGYTFMTDVPFMAAMAAAGYCYVRALAAPRGAWWFAGSLIGAWGLLIRQFALLVPLAAALAFLPLALRLNRREQVRLGIAFLLPWIAAGMLLSYLPSYAAALGHTWDPSVLGTTFLGQFGGAFKFYGLSMVYLALFCAPVLVAPCCEWFRRDRSSRGWRIGGFVLFFVLLAIVVCWSAPRRIPFLGNLLYDTGVGPMTLKGIFMGSYLWRPVSIGAWWWLPTLVGLLGAAWMVAGTVRWFILIPGDGRRPATDPYRRQRLFLMLWAVFMIAALYHPWLPVRFDRYLLGALVPVLLLVASATAGRRPVVAGVQVVLFGVVYAFSLIGIQDYMAWNTARWDAVNELMAEGVPPAEIDGGYEFNGWYTSPVFIEEDGPQAFLDSGELGWWAVGDAYAISWLPRPRFDKVKEIPYDSWLAGEKGMLWLLEKEPE